MKNIKSLYDQQKYHDIIQILNPRMDPSIPLPSGTSYMYIWSLVRLHLLTSKFPEPNSREIIDRIVLFIDRYDSRNDKLRDIIHNKRELLKANTSLLSASLKSSNKSMIQHHKSQLQATVKNNTIEKNIESLGQNGIQNQNQKFDGGTKNEITTNKYENKGQDKTHILNSTSLDVDKSYSSVYKFEKDNLKGIRNKESRLSSGNQDNKNIDQIYNVVQIANLSEITHSNVIEVGLKDDTGDQNEKNIESDYLEYIVQLIESEISKEDLRIKKLREDSENYKNSNPIEYMQLKSIIDQKRKRMNDLVEMKEEPYFLKFEYAEKTDIRKSKTFFIGKKELWTNFTYYVYDWRFNDNAMQNNIIEFFEEDIEYRVLLRRRYNILNGSLINYHDVYAYSKDLIFNQIVDPFLREVILRKRRTKEITDIISTIQQHQYSIISDKRQKHRIVEGCAGSGKTMVLLHRLSYQAYNNELYKNDHYLIVPSNTYLTQVTKLMQKLDLINVKTCTITEFFKILIKSVFPDVSFKTNDNFNINLANTDATETSFLSDLIDETIQKFAHHLMNEEERKVIDGFESIYGGNIIGNDYRTNIKDLRFRLNEINEMSKRISSTEKTLGHYRLLMSQLEYVSKVTIERTKLKMEVIDKMKDDYIVVIQEVHDFSKILSVMHLGKIEDSFADYMKQKYKLRDLIDRLDGGKYASYFKRLETKLQIIEMNVSRYIKESKKSVNKDLDDNNYRASKYLNASLHEILMFKSKIESAFEGDDDNVNHISKILQLLEESRYSELSSNFNKLKSESLSVFSDFEEVYFDFKKNELNFNFAIFAEEKMKHDKDNFWAAVTEITEKYNSIFADPLQLINLIFRNIFSSSISIVNGNYLTENRTALWFVIFMISKLGLRKTFNPFGVFIDEAQEISIPEYRALLDFLPKTFFELYGDPKQFTQHSSEFKWEEIGLNNVIIDKLNQNYRNPNTITEYINNNLNLDIVPIGIESGIVKVGSSTDLYTFVREHLDDILTSRTVCITRDFSCVPNEIESVGKLLSINYGSLEEGKFNILTINDVKGLEFEYVFVFEKDMSLAEKYVSYSRALNTLFILKNM